MVLLYSREYPFIMTTYVVITEEIEQIVNEPSKERREELGELMKAVPLDLVLREAFKEEIRRVLNG
jgi:hypothetical protein